MNRCTTLGCYAIAGMAGVVWGFVVSTVLVNDTTFFINSLAHAKGSFRGFASSAISKRGLHLLVRTIVDWAMPQRNPSA